MDTVSSTSGANQLGKRGGVGREEWNNFSVKKKGVKTTKRGYDFFLHGCHS